MSNLTSQLNQILTSPEFFRKLSTTPIITATADSSSKKHNTFSLTIDAILQILNTARNAWVYGSKLRFAHSLTLMIIFSRFTSVKQFKQQIIKVAKNSQKHGLSLTTYAFLYKAIFTILQFLKAKRALAMNSSAKHHSHHTHDHHNHHLLHQQHRQHNNISSTTTSTSNAAKNLKTNDSLEYAFNHFASGFLAGYVVYGNQVPYFSNSITQQVSLYIFSRVVLGVSRLIGEKFSLWAVLLQKHQNINNANVNLNLKSSPEFKKFNGKLNEYTWNIVSAASWGTIMVLWKYHPKVLNYSVVSSMDYIYETYSWNNLKQFFGSDGKIKRGH